MMNPYNKYIKVKKLFLLPVVICLMLATLLSSCSDEPDSEHYYTFKGQMMSQYLEGNENFSEFATIVKRAKLMDQLSVYGHYTCFAPTNAAVDHYLDSLGISLDQLTEADCDTIARTHLVAVMYSTSDLGTYDKGVLPAQNMMKRNLQVTHAQDENNNTVCIINGTAQIFFEHQNDSVENGIVHPVNNIIENSTNSLANLIKTNPQVSIYYAALEATGLETQLDTLIKDKNYDVDEQPEYVMYTTGAEGTEYAIAPKTKNYGFTAFLVTDEVLAQKHNIRNLRGLYDEACKIYDEMYPDDVAKEGHSFENLNDPINPLYRFMAYHLLNRNVQGYNYLTVRNDLGVDYRYANPTDWYATLLTHTMIKVEHLIKSSWTGTGVYKGYYINRRWDDNYTEPGIQVLNPVDEVTDAINGTYFYLDDYIKFDATTRDVVDNCRIRMDMSTIFPEIMTNNMRMNGDCSSNTAASRKNIDDENIGFNYYFPQDYLDGVTISGSNARFVYRRPRMDFYSAHGDEMVANGVFDITFPLPPFPFEGDWQIRLGFAAMNTAPRGAVQIYFDNKAVDIPLNMDILINSPEIYGSTGFPNYSSIREDEDARMADFKILKNKGYYRGPWSIVGGGFNSSTIVQTPGSGWAFAGNSSTIRKVLCTVTISEEDLEKVHTLRIKNVTKTNAKDKEAMLDYIEFVPKSVYGVSDGKNAEDDL